MHAAHILRKYDPAQWGGTETAVLRLVQGLRQHGVSSSVHAPHGGPPPAADPLIEAGATVRRYHAFVPVVGISPRQREELVSWGGNLFSFDLFGHLLQSRCDIVHSHALNRLAGIGLTAARLRGVPHVVTLHGGALDVPKEVSDKLTAPLQGGFEWGKALGILVRSRRVLELTDAIFTCNPREAALLQQKYPQQRVIVQPHSVPAAQYAVDHRIAALKAFPQIADRDLIVKVARLDPAKNLPWLVRQLPEIKRRHPRAMLVLIGAGTTQSVVEELHRDISRLGLESDVLLTGGLPSGSAELIGLMQSARLFVLSSTAEPFGIVILEAWAAGLPVVASRVGGIPSFTRDGEDILHAIPGDSGSLAAALLRLLEQPGLARRLAAAGQTKARRDYDWSRISERLLSLYRDLVRR